MLIKNFLDMIVLDKNANRVGKVVDVDFNPKTGSIESVYVALEGGIFSTKQIEIEYKEIDSIGDYLLLSVEVPDEVDES